jgi:hypothetical protein
MNFKCTICDAVVRSQAAMRCPECGARADFQVRTADQPRHARSLGNPEQRVWEFSPDGPRVRRIK